ncbi:MAG: hypothetical protein U5N86_13400 [Planctomycetota bacterium]|nr:hypothetical protein [Planctomycetota bacterium]
MVVNDPPDELSDVDKWLRETGEKVLAKEPVEDLKKLEEAADHPHEADSQPSPPVISSSSCPTM